MKRPRSSASVWQRSPFLECSLDRYALNAGGRSWTGDFLIVDTEDLQPIPPSERHVKKDSKPKEVTTISTETMNVYSRGGRAKSCKWYNRYPPLCAKRVATTCENLSKNLQKKKKKPEMQIQMLKLNKISGTL